MNTKSKVWQIVLLALLVLAIVAILLFNNKLNASKESLSNTMAQLSEEQENSAALQANLESTQADLDATRADLETAQADYADVSAKLDEANANAEQLQSDLDTANANVEQMQTDLDTANANVEQLQTDLDTANANATQLQSDLDAANERVSELESAVAERDQTIEALNAGQASVPAATDAGAVLTDADAVLTDAHQQLEGALVALEEAQAGDAVLSEEAAVADIAAIRERVNAIVADAEKSPEEKLEELNAVREELSAMMPELDLPAFELNAQAEEGPVEPDPLTEATAAANDAIAAVETLQSGEDAPEAVTAIDVAQARADVEAVLADESLTPEEQVEALGAIEQTMTAVLPDETAEAVDELADLQARLEASEEHVEQLSTDLEDKLATIDDLNTQIEELDAQAESDAAQLADLQTQLDVAEAEAQTLSDELETARTEYAENLAEVEAYHVQRDPASGEAHIATALDNAIEVDADGVTATWQYANSDLSGNAATLSLVLDGETLYTSEALKPGEVIDSVTLNKPLAPGTYQALAVTTVYDADGEVQLTSRVPVTLNVAG